MRELIVCETPNAWLERVVNDFVCEVLEPALSRLTPENFLHIALAGGTTPVALYKRLSLANLPWHRLMWWVGDERDVPADSPLRNELMIRQTLGARILAENPSVFHVQGWGNDVPLTLDTMQSRLAEFLSPQYSFPLIFLGLGTDGHTASLFSPPDASLLSKDRLVCETKAPDGMRRLSLSYSLLNSAERVWFLVAGAEKYSVMQRVLDNDPALPAQHVLGCLQTRIYYCAEKF